VICEAWPQVACTLRDGCHRPVVSTTHPTTPEFALTSVGQSELEGTEGQVDIERPLRRRRRVRADMINRSARRTACNRDTCHTPNDAMVSQRITHNDNHHGATHPIILQETRECREGESDRDRGADQEQQRGLRPSIPCNTLPFCLPTKTSRFSLTATLPDAVVAPCNAWAVHKSSAP
jgi:hypothetical protein